MKFTRTLLLVFAVVLLLPLILNVKNSNAKTGIGGYGGYMFIYGYKFAKHHQKKYYALCKKRENNFVTDSYGSDDKYDSNLSNTNISSYNTSQYFIEKCLQGVQTYKEIHKK